MTNVAECDMCGGTGKIIKNKCDICGGKGLLNKTRTINVKIPAGIDEGQIMTLRAEGNASKTGETGDLRILVGIGKHNLLTRDRFNLYVTVPIPYTLSLLGGTITVPGIKEKLELKIPALTQTGTVFKLKNKGIKHLNRNSYGDLFVTVEIEMPKVLDKEDKKILEKLAKQTSDDSFSKYNKYKDNLKNS